MVDGCRHGKVIVKKSGLSKVDDLGVPFFLLFVMGNSQVESGRDCFSPWIF